MKKFSLSLKLLRPFRCLWNDELGQSTTEYILILSVVVMIAMKFKTLFGSKIEGLVTTLSGKIDSATQDSSN